MHHLSRKSALFFPSLPHARRDAPIWQRAARLAGNFECRTAAHDGFEVMLAKMLLCFRDGFENNLWLRWRRWLLWLRRSFIRRGCGRRWLFCRRLGITAGRCIIHWRRLRSFLVRFTFLRGHGPLV